MGYQESYIYAKEENEFAILLDKVIELSKIWDEEWSMYTTGILMINSDVDINCDYNIHFLKKGKKLIHITGERAGQRSLARMFGDYPFDGFGLMPAECLHYLCVNGKVDINKNRNIDFEYQLLDEYLSEQF
ncbi:hypothetical protein [Fusibacter tunisiensis]|uniref:Uncharacterized protein n=1 Tax=Fusibacter tunisiensis TaxID=1008308 RepID=A0ABS2MT63_9FIRM|nr:hypothetical protein [Fusibacter tunisiensis]MBM7562611.1 hypothetical protein [Fusibacter tunisiensis]